MIDGGLKAAAPSFSFHEHLMSEEKTTIEADVPQGSPPPGPPAPPAPDLIIPEPPPAPPDPIISSPPPMTHTDVTAENGGIAGYAVEPPAQVESETVMVTLTAAPSSPLRLSVNGAAVTLRIGQAVEIPRAFLPALRDAGGVAFAI